MEKTSKLIIFILSVIVSVFWYTNLSFAQDNWFGSDRFADEIKVPWTDKKQEDSLLKTIQTTINWVLWMLALVSLVLCLYAWFKMLTSWWDSKAYSAWFGILKSAALWLAIIALSWLFVSFIFWVININTEPNI